MFEMTRNIRDDQVIYEEPRNLIEDLISIPRFQTQICFNILRQMQCSSRVSKLGTVLLHDLDDLEIDLLLHINKFVPVHGVYKVLHHNIFGTGAEVHKTYPTILVSTGVFINVLLNFSYNVADLAGCGVVSKRNVKFSPPKSS